MISLKYEPDNFKYQEVFDRLVYGLKDTTGVYIQKGMPETLMFDKRMQVVPYKEFGAIFRIESKDDPSERIYYILLNNVTDRFLVNEEVTIRDTISFIKNNVYGTVKSSQTNAISIKLSTDIELNDTYLGFTISGSTSKSTATIRTIDIGSSTYHPHTLTVVPYDITHPTVEQTYFKSFVPTKDITFLQGVILGKGWNYVVVENETTKERAEAIINCRYYATIIQSIADEIYNWVNFPIDTEHDNIFHYQSTRLCELYLKYKEFMPNIDTIQRLGLMLSVKSLISFSGSNISTKELGTAITGNTPLFTEQQVDENVLPAIWDMFNKPQDFAGFDMDTWIRNRQIMRWVTFLRYINNVPFYQLHSVTENDVSVVKTMPFFGYYMPIKKLPIYQCSNCGYAQWTEFVLCPSCNLEERIDTICLDFKVGETLRFPYGETATIAVVYPKGLTLSNFSEPAGNLGQIVIGEDSRARAEVLGLPIEHHDWNKPVSDGTIDGTCLEKNLEWHQFDFSNEPLNDDWRILSCWAGVNGTLSISSIIPFAICAAFHPWDRFVNLLLSYEPTLTEEEWYRTHQLDIDIFWEEYPLPPHDVYLSSSSSEDYRTITYSRHSDYPTKIDEGEALLNTFIYSGPDEPLIYSSLLYNAVSVPLNGFVTGSEAQSPLDLEHPVYNYLGTPMLLIIFNGVFGYVEYIESQWTNKNTSIQIDNNILGWYADMPMNPTTFLPDISLCQGFECNILDQAVDWSYIDAPVTNTVVSWTWIV